MKCRAGLLALAGTLVLTGGCSAMLERSYLSSAAHVDYYATEEDPSILRAENYQGLINSILYFVENHAATGTIRLYNYTGDVEADLASACTEILSEDPLGAYAVRDIRYDTARIVTYYEISLSIIYARSAQEVEEVQTVTGLTGLRRSFSQAVSGLRDHAAIRTSYFSWTEQYLSQLFWIALYSQPLYAMQEVGVDFTLYPSSGPQRIIEMTISWPQPAQILSQRAARLTGTVSLLLLDHPPAGEEYTPGELAAVLAALASYDAQGSDDPEEILAGSSGGELGLMLTLELLCQQGEVDVHAVPGTAGQQVQVWLIVDSPDGYRHLLAGDLAAYVAGGLDNLPLYTDGEMSQMGYHWPKELYPACSD